MISLFYDKKNYYRAYAIKHFIQKYGLPAEVNAEAASINIVCGKGREQLRGFMIQVLENKIEEDVVGYLKYNNDEIALFERAWRLLPGDITLATFYDGNQEYPCVTIEKNTIIIGFDLFQEVGRILSGHLEKIWTASDGKCAHISQLPLVDCYEHLLFDCILLAGEKMNIPIERKAFWPEARPFALCLSHDVDKTAKGWQYLFYILKSLKDLNLKGVWNQLLSLGHKLSGREPYWNFDRIIELESWFGIKSTFYFLNEQGKAKLLNLKSMVLYLGRYDINHPKIHAIINKLHAAGWEIGIHGSYSSYNDKELFQSEKDSLEKILGERIYGGRQHYLNLEIPKTWRIHLEVRLEYDSTLGFTHNIGFRFGTGFPFFPFDTIKKEQIGLLEIPMIIMDKALFMFSAPWLKAKKLVETIEKYGGVLVLNWHQSLFNPYELMVYKELYRELITLCQKKNAWITTLSDVNNWWRYRLGFCVDTCG